VRSPVRVRSPDLARLFEHGLLCVEPDGFVVRLHASVRGAARGPTAYAPLDGRPLQVVPERFDLLPSRELLADHVAAYRAEVETASRAAVETAWGTAAG